MGAVYDVVEVLVLEVVCLPTKQALRHGVDE
jgi:hypothetical protein